MTAEPPRRLDYQSILKEALRDAVRRVLARVAEHGLPGDHYFYIAFRTGHPGVAVPRFLRERYPEEMTIVLQHQFWNLEVTPEEFSVELTFNASRQRLRVPLAALTAFIDPSADFALRFEGSAEAEAASPRAGEGSAVRPAPSGANFASPVATGTPETRAESGSEKRPRRTLHAAPPPPPSAPRSAGTKRSEDPPPPPAGSGGGVIRFDPKRRR